MVHLVGFQGTPMAVYARAGARPTVDTYDVIAERRAGSRELRLVDVCELLERRAAPFSQNIREAFEVLVGAARVKDSVKYSEARIAAHEAKRQEDDPMDTD